MVIETKLNIPKARTALVARPRLHGRLERGLGVKLTLITAPAGYGKTTLMAEWAAQLEGPVAWISLDRQDRQGLRFWHHTIAALKRALPSFDDESVVRCATADPSGETFVAALLNSLNRVAESTVIVWDDFHYADDPLLLRGIGYLLECLPDHLHLYMASRICPALPLAKMRAAGTLNELDLSELAFTAQESFVFFNENQKMSLTEQEMEVVLRQTEGWAAGMRLIALSSHDQTGRAMIIQGLIGEHRNIADYFFEEVFHLQSRDVQQFLLRTSILERMNAELCQAVTEIDRCHEILQQLDQMSLFLIPLDKKREWYRYHHLFQDFLRLKLYDQGQMLQQDLHLASGDWLAAHDHSAEAMEHYLAGEHNRQALNLLERLMPGLMQSDLDAFLRWANRIPDDLLYDKLSVLTSVLTAMLLTGKIDAAKEKIRRASEQLARMQSELPESALQQFRSGLLVAQMQCAYFDKDFDTEIYLAERVVSEFPDGVHLTNLGCEGDLQIPVWALVDTLGNMKEQVSVYRRYLAVWTGIRHYFAEADVNMGYGEYMYEWNRLEEAERHWERTKQLGEAYHNPIAIAFGHILLAKLACARGQFDRMNQLLNDVEEKIEPRLYPNLNAYIDVYQAYIRWMAGDVPKAMRWLQRTNLRWKDEIPSTMLLEYGTLACLLMEQGKLNEAEFLLGRLIHAAERSGRKRDRLRLLIQHSLLAERQGNTMLSMDRLEEVLSWAEPEGYLRTFIDAGSPLMALLRQYFKIRQKQHRQQKHKVSLAYVKRLLKYEPFVYGGGETEVGLSLDIHLTAKEEAILQLLTTDLTNQQIASRQGVSISTVKTHIANLYDKLRVHNRMAALERAKQRGLLPQQDEGSNGIR
ncbi:LuxR C-terminal-related transcriptional regulator [Cohnella cellulosilytica]|uniref:LuxR C-terminal-related transcriptional regulator n=1 Tax=Cohnella cellulosilytica TaxID=986710 RepID=A0ABW2FMT8_9BACL